MWLSRRSDDLDGICRVIDELGLERRPPRSRVEGEGQSVYFYDDDNHLFELHTGSLRERLSAYLPAGSVITAATDVQAI